MLWAGSVEDAAKWEKFIAYLASVANDSAETGYDIEPLKDDLGLLSWQTFHTLRAMGVTIPSSFPVELDFDYEARSDERAEVFESHPLASLIFNIFLSLNDVWGFYAAYVHELVFDDDLDLVGTPAEDIDACLIELAAAKVDVDLSFALKIDEFRRRTKDHYETGLNIVKDKAFRAGIPLRAELLNLVHVPHGQLGAEAEHESFGFNASRLHPDVYMNELLCGMRAIHQVLPAIMKKLGIDEEFQLDESEFRIR